MPELPEVEVICQGLFPHLVGRNIRAVTGDGKTLRSPVPIDLLEEHLVNRTIRDVRRRAKYLLIETEENALLIIHLGMTGTLTISSVASPRKTHDHVFWLFDNDKELRLNDVRRFGSVHLLLPDEAAVMEDTFFASTGPEPFAVECSPDYLMLQAKGKKMALKSFLMQNKIIAGIGNIYANESLFGAQMHPSRQAGSLTRHEWQRLHKLIRQILQHAISCGGSTISDFMGASGESGYFQMNFKVYGKNGNPCPTCKTLLKKKQIGGRASFYCPKCQG